MSPLSGAGRYFAVVRVNRGHRSSLKRLGGMDAPLPSLPIPMMLRVQRAAINVAALHLARALKDSLGAAMATATKWLEIIECIGAAVPDRNDVVDAAREPQPSDLSTHSASRLGFEYCLAKLAPTSPIIMSAGHADSSFPGKLTLGYELASMSGCQTPES